MYLLLGFILIGFILQIVGTFKSSGDLIFDGFFLQAIALFLAIPMLA